MTQLERMKEYVVNQIEIMITRQFLKVSDMIIGTTAVQARHHLTA